MVGLVIKLTQERLTGKKKKYILICAHRVLLERVPKKWPKQASFILFVSNC